MTEEEVLAQLRDIHLPADLAGAAPLAFALWPFLVLTGLVCLVLVLRLVGRNRWRRAATEELARISAVQDPANQWQMLLAFATSISERAGRPFALPDIAFKRPEQISDAERTAFVDYLRAELAR